MCLSLIHIWAAEDAGYRAVPETPVPTRRKPLPEQYEIVITLVGFAALMCLMLFVTYNDSARLITG